MNSNEFPRCPIPSVDVDYREVARMMRINVDILKKEITEHVNDELTRFHEGMKVIDE